MQIYVRDVKNKKMKINAEIVISQTAWVPKFNFSAFVLKKCDLQMSYQRDLQVSGAWRVIARLESGQSQRSFASAVGPARNVIAVV